MDFLKLKAITIPEGNVIKLVCGDVILWQRLLSRLPKEYQELAYISADVNSEAYFDLGFAFDTKAKIYMMQKIGTQVAGNNGYIFGAAENSGKLCCMLTSPFKSNGGSSLYGSDGSAFNLTVATVVENADNEFEMTLEKGHVRITNLTNNYTNKLTNQAEYTMTNNLYLFAQNYNGKPRFGYDRIIKYFKYYDKNNELTYDLIPCYRKIDNKIGMYNVAKKQFFKNIGEGEFTAWHGDYYVNLLSWATDKDGTIFNGIGYKPGYRVNSSGGVSDASNKPLMCAGGFIPAKVGDIVRIKGAYPVQGVAPYLVTYNSHQTLITHKQFGVTATGKGTPTDVDWSTVASAATFYSYENGILTIPLTEENFGTGITYFRISMHMNENTIVTVNQEIPSTYTNLAEPLPNNTTDTSKWVNGYRFSSSAITAQEGTTLSNHIFCKKGDVIRIKGVDLRGSADRFYVYVPDHGIDLQYWNVGSNFWTCEVVDGVYVVTITDYGAVERFRFAMPTPTDPSQVIVTVNEEIPNNHANMLPYATDTDETIYNSVGYAENMYLSSGVPVSRSGIDCTGFIPIGCGSSETASGEQIIRLKNVSYDETNNSRFALYTADETHIQTFYGTHLDSNGYDIAIPHEIDASGNVTYIDITAISARLRDYADAGETAYLRISCPNIDSNSVITVNREIPKDAYTNILKTNGTVELNKRYSASSNGYKDCNGMVTLKIPIANVRDKTIYFKGFSDILASGTNATWYLISSAEAQIGSLVGDGTSNPWTCGKITTDSNGVSSITVNTDSMPLLNDSNVAYLVINMAVSESAISSLDGYVMTIDEKINTQPEEEVFNNWIPYSTEDDDITIYNNGLGYKDGYRVRSGGAEIEDEYGSITGYIPLKVGDTLRIYPHFVSLNTQNTINFYDESFAVIGQITNSGSVYGSCTANYQPLTTDEFSVLTLNSTKHDSSISYVRITNAIRKSEALMDSGAEMKVTVNEFKSGNLFDQNDPNILLGGRINSSGSAVAYQDGQLVTGWIEAKNGDAVTISSDKSQLTNNYTGMMALYKLDKTYIGQFTNVATAVGGWTWASDNLSGTVTISNSYANGWSCEGCAYVRFCIPYTDINSIVITKR